MLEPLDAQIVRLLAEDGRLSFTELGRQTGLSTSAAHQRVRRLEQRGVITGYSAPGRPAPARPGADGVRLDPARSTRASPTTHRSGWPGSPEITSCYSVAGDESYILHGAGGQPARARGPAGPHPGRGQRLDPHDHGAVDAVRAPAAGGAGRPAELATGG